jgi:lysine 2,3-aminomutase
MKPITEPEELAKKFNIPTEPIRQVAERYPMRISPRFLRLLREPGDPVWRQVVPDPLELDDTGLVDPLAEDSHSPVPGLTHRYPDRVLFLVSNECPVLCRFCTRKRKAGRFIVRDEDIEHGLNYIAGHPEVRDVLLSGGDALLLSDEKLDWILRKVREIPHVEIIRIGTRSPTALPERVTPKLASLLARANPVYVLAHVNHSLELTEEAKRAFKRLADAGIPLGSQTVLLKNVNDDAGVLAELFQKLVGNRVRPYYLLHADQTLGTAHFWTSVQTGMDILSCLNRLSGLARPAYVMDLSGGGGKVPLGKQGNPKK